MCGLVASVGKGSVERVERCLSLLGHRGVRSRVEEVRGGAVGHVRLPIVGLGEENDQPVQSGDWTVAFVGELLDFRERRPYAACDVGLVVDTWTDEGPDGFRKFDGFWHVVAHDWKDGSLHCLCDYLAQKPLYRRTDVALVASEPDAAAAAGPVTLDLIYLSAVVKWGYCPETWRTPYREVVKLLPGEYCVLEPDGQVRSSRVADPLEPVEGSPDELRAEILAAVKRRVTSSDVPVACLVSGGLDSAIVWTLAQRYGVDVRAFHVENGELDECRLVAPGAEVLPADEVPLAECLRMMQEPLDLGSLVPQCALSKAVGAQGIRVCLTGDGADEFWGGYGRSMRYDSQASDVFHELVAWHLPRLDRAMMCNLVEVRSPFLARRVAGIALGLPRTARYNKGVLRSLFRTDLPPGVADAPKRPLRTKRVEDDRESRSMELVRMFVENLRGTEICRR